MTKTTTGSSRLTVILSWMIALICFVGGALYIWKMPSPDQEVIALQMKQQKNQKSRKSLTEKVKQEQAQRALPANYARQLVEQSEVLVKKNLEEQVKKFQTMAGTMRRRKDDMLAKVEKRKLPWGAPADANDTSKARAIPRAGNPSDNASVEELYAVLLLQARCERLTDIPEKVDFFDALPDYDLAFYTNKKSKTDAAVSLEMLQKVLPKLEALNDWSTDGIHDMLIAFAEELGVKNATLMWPLRIACAGKLVTPGGAVEICKILGKDETIRRVKCGIEKLGG